MTSLGDLIRDFIDGLCVSFILVLDHKLFVHQLVHIDKSSFSIVMIGCLLLLIFLLNSLFTLGQALLFRVNARGIDSFFEEAAERLFRSPDHYGDDFLALVG